MFILAAAAILVAFAIAIGDLSFGRTWRIHAEYGFAGSIHPGAPVRVSGLQIGRVSKVELIGEERRDDSGRPLLVRLTLDLEERARGVLREDTELCIATTGVLGEAYIDAVTGRMEGAPLEPGATVRGTDPPRTDLLLARAHTFLESVSDIIDEDAETARELLHLLTRLARMADEALDEDADGLATLLARMHGAVEDLAHVAAEARRQMDDGGDLSVLLSRGRAAVTELRRELPEVLASLRRSSERLEAATTLLEGLGEDDLQKARDVLERYERAGAHLEALAGDVQRVVDRIDRGDGTIGALLNDEQVYEDLRDLLEDLRAHPWKLLWRR